MANIFTQTAASCADKKENVTLDFVNKTTFSIYATCYDIDNKLADMTNIEVTAKLYQDEIYLFDLKVTILDQTIAKGALVITDINSSNPNYPLGDLQILLTTVENGVTETELITLNVSFGG